MNGQKEVFNCAVYTRKSHEEGLEQEFNSLDAQYEAGKSYVMSQRSRGWRLIPDRYDDGGFSGGTMERPAFKRLLADVYAGKIDVIVVYKIDRFSRSLLDFTKLYADLQERGVGVVSVTQQFDTSSATGRLFINILMTFAQYEREQTGDRIRDKIAAAKKRGKYTGGWPVLGYAVNREKRKLEVIPEEARLVRHIFKRFLETGSKELIRELNARGKVTKRFVTKKGKEIGGLKWNTHHLYRLLNNPVYTGVIEYHGERYPGEHEAIIDTALFEKVQTTLAENCRDRSGTTRSEIPALLKGIIRCGSCGSAMAPTYTKKGDRRYSYYVCNEDTKRGESECPVNRLPAGDLEKAVGDQLNAVFRSPSLIAKTCVKARQKEEEDTDVLNAEKKELETSLNEKREVLLRSMDGENETAPGSVESEIAGIGSRLAEIAARLKKLESRRIEEKDIAEALNDTEWFWEDLYPQERQRLIRLLVGSVTVNPEGIDIILKGEGLSSLTQELCVNEEEDLKDE